MKLTPLFCSLGLLTLAACESGNNTESKVDVTEAISAATEVKSPGRLSLVDQPSEDFFAVARHLDVGGESFKFSENARLVATLTELMEAFQPDLDQVYNEDSIDMAGVFGATALGGIRATGSSVARKGEYFESRGFLYSSGSHEGLLGLMGDETVDSIAAEYVPMGADLVLEQSLDIKHAMRMLKLLRKHLSPELQDEIDDTFGLSLSPGLSLKALLSNLNLRVLLAIEVDPEGIEKTGDFAEQYEGIVVVTNASLVWDLVKKKAEEQDFEIADRAGLKCITVPAGIQGPDDKMQLAYDPSKKVLMLSTSQAYLDRCMGLKESIANSPDFERTMAEFASSNNAMGYLSPQAIEVIKRYSEKAIRDETEESDAIYLSKLQKAFAKYGYKNAGFGYAVKVVPEGILFVVRSKSEPLQISSAGTYAVTGMPVLFISARAWIEGSNKAKCIVNMASIQKAGISYANLNRMAPDEYDEITLQMLIDEKMLPRDISCPSGGNYIFTPINGDQDRSWIHCDCEEGHALDLGF